MRANKVRSILKIISFVLFIFFFPGVLLTADESISEGAKNFLMLRKLYMEWNGGLFGSQNSYRRELYMFCVDLIDKEIETEPEFILLSPVKYGEQSVESLLRTPNSSWLYIHGPVKADESILQMRPLPGSWEQSLNFLRIKGTVRKFRFGRDHLGNTVDLWLEEVMLY